MYLDSTIGKTSISIHCVLHITDMVDTKLNDKNCPVRISLNFSSSMSFLPPCSLIHEKCQYHAINWVSLLTTTLVLFWFYTFLLISLTYFRQSRSLTVQGSISSSDTRDYLIPGSIAAKTAETMAHQIIWWAIFHCRKRLALAT